MKISRKNLAIALNNGITRKALNKRLSLGWDMEGSYLSTIKKKTCNVREVVLQHLSKKLNIPLKE